MKLRAIEIDKKFIPEWNGNRKLPANEQVIIFFTRIPGTTEKNNYTSIRMTQGGGFELVYNDNLLFSTFIQKIENLEIGSLKIAKGADLATAVHPKIAELATEIRQYLFPEDEEMSAGESQA